jgi:hypothetical protein
MVNNVKISKGNVGGQENMEEIYIIRAMMEATRTSETFHICLCYSPISIMIVQVFKRTSHQNVFSF